MATGTASVTNKFQHQPGKCSSTLEFADERMLARAAGVDHVPSCCAKAGAAMRAHGQTQASLHGAGLAGKL